MTEIRRSLYIPDNNVETLNQVFLHLQDRLDELEGRRGSPTVYNTLDMAGNKLINVGTSTTTVVSGTVVEDDAGGAVNLEHPLMPKAWAYIDSGGTIKASYGVSRASRVSTGDYDVYWEKAFTSSNYAVIATVVNTADDPIISTGPQTTAKVSIHIKRRNTGADMNSGFGILALGVQQ